MVFVYPAIPHVRRHGPLGYSDYHSFKPWLRDDFTFRCVFCLVRERWFPMGHDAFSVEHLVPKCDAPDRECDYENLVYACCRCNSAKSDVWPVLNPCEVAFADHLRVREDGQIKGLTTEGRKLIKVLRLDHPKLVKYRRELLNIVRVLPSKNDGDGSSRLRYWLGFPDDLPNLVSLRPPSGNSRPEGVKQSYHARRQRLELEGAY